jgi:hypothetical protein
VSVFRILCAISLVAICWQLFQALRFQEFRMRAGLTIYKHESPRLFWLIFVSSFPLMGVLLAIVLFAR